MTSRERLMSVIQHKIPDRVPVSTYELVGWKKYSWENQQPSYHFLMETIRQKTDCLYMTGVATTNRYVKHHQYIEQWKEGHSTFARTILTTPRGDLTKLDRQDENLNTVWHLEHFIKSDEDVKRYLSIPDDPVPVDISSLKEQDQSLGDRGILLVDVADALCLAAELFEFGDFTIKAFTDRAVFTRLLHKIFELQMFFLEDMLKKGAGPLFRIVGPEYATAPYLNEALFHEYVCKYDRKMIELIHEYGQYARIHCHGRIRNILPHILEMEADALDPVEGPPSGDMELGEVKKFCGDKLCLMGNIQIRDLEYASPEEMKRIVLKCMEAAKPEGNYVIMPTASPISIPLSPTAERNYQVLIDTALEYGRYE